MENILIYVAHDTFRKVSVLSISCGDKCFQFEMNSNKTEPYPCVELQRPEIIELTYFLQKILNEEMK